MKKFLSIIMALAMILSLAACSQASESDLDEILTEEEEVTEKVTEEPTEDITSTGSKYDPNDPSTFDFTDRDFPYVEFHPDMLEMYSEDIFLMWDEVGAIDEYTNKWYLVTLVTLVDESNSGVEFTSNSGFFYMSRSLIDTDIFENAMNSGTPISIMGYFCNMNGNYGFDNCMIYDGELDDSYYEEDIAEYASDPTGPNGEPPAGYEDEAGNSYSQSQSNIPASGQIMDGFVGAMQDAAQNNPDATEEQKEFAQAYADAWEFYQAMQGW